MCSAKWKVLERLGLPICNCVAVIIGGSFKISSTFAAMRLSALILNLLILVMIFVPCKDHKALSGEGSRAQAFHATTPQSSPADDDCSPLCTCSCCGTVSLFYALPQLATVLPEPAIKKYAAYKAPFYSVERSSVWQPPRIA